MIVPSQSVNSNTKKVSTNRLLETAKANALAGIPVVRLFGIRAECDSSGNIYFRCECGKPNCDRPGKHPATRRGHYSATTNIEEIEFEWNRYPNSNVAVVLRGTLRIDIDHWHEFDQLAKVLGPLPTTLTLQTGRGWHCFFRKPEGLTLVSHLAQNVEVLDGDKGYCIIPPSRHRSGREYAWCPSPQTPIVSLPFPWLAHMQRMASAPRQASHGEERGVREGNRVAQPIKHDDEALIRWATGITTDCYGRSALASECRKVRESGMTSNDQSLNNASFKMGLLVGKERLSWNDVTESLIAAGVTTGREYEAVVRVVHKALLDGIQKQRSLGR